MKVQTKLLILIMYTASLKYIKIYSNLKHVQIPLELSKGPVPNWLLRDFEQFFKKNITHNYYLHKKKITHILGHFILMLQGHLRCYPYIKKKPRGPGN